MSSTTVVRHGGSPASLLAQYSLARPVLLASGWITPTAAGTVRQQLAKLPPTTASRNGRSLLTQALLDLHLLTVEQATDLDLISATQAALPAFVITRKLGSGSMGTVFLATMDGSPRQVALKTMRPQWTADDDGHARFLREVASLRQVKSEHVAQILDAGEAGTTLCWMAQEYVNGPSLMELVERQGSLPEADALHLAKQVALGLAEAWETGKLVHRDIKPQNVLVEPEADDQSPLPGRAGPRSSTSDCPNPWAQRRRHHN